MKGQNPLDIQIEIAEPYPVELDYYLENANNLFITIANLTGIDQQIYYHVKLIGNNGFEAQTYDFVKPGEPVTVPSYRTLFYSGDEIERDFSFSYPEDVDLSMLSMDQLDYVSLYRALPEGTYQLCITARDYNTDIPLTFECSDEFTVSYGDAPFLYAPYDGEVVPSSENSHITFAWEPPFTLAPPPNSFTYNLKVVDITEPNNGDVEWVLTDPGTWPVLDQFDLIETVFNYDAPPEINLIEGHQYAARVQAIDLTGSYPLANGGYSEISTFWYGYNAEEEDGIDDEDGPTDTQNDCFLNCYYEESIDANPISDATTLNEILVGQFVVENLNITEPGGSAVSGTGEIEIPFLNDVRINVSFSNIGVNTAGRMYSGTVEAVVDKVYDPTAMTSSIAEEMNNFIRNGRVVSSLIGGNAIGMPLGLIQNLGGYNFMFGFTQMTFSPTTAQTQIMHNLHLPSFGEDGWVSMAASDVCLIPGGFGGEYAIHPVNDVLIPYQGETSLYISGSTAANLEDITDEATFFEMDCNGVKRFGLRGEVHFPRETLVIDNEDGSIGEGKVVATFATEFDRTVDESSNIYALYGEEGLPEEAGIHFMLQLDIDPFQIAGIPAWGFSAQNAWLDVSDFDNPPGIQWPESYDDANISFDSDSGDFKMMTTWTGVYIEELEMRTPPDFLMDNTREAVSVNHMIIDPLVTMTVAVEDLIQLGEGGVDDWSLSMDSLFLSIVQNRLESGGFSGLLGMPITEAGQYFRYTALITDSDTENTSLDPPSYVFSVSPEDDIKFPFLVAQAALSENSYVLGKFTPNQPQQTYFEAFLEGGIGINSSIFTPEDDDPGIPLYLPVVDFQLVYHSQNGISESAFGFTDELTPFDSDSPGEINYDLDWGLSFSEESFAGFPLNIEDAGIRIISPQEIQFFVEPKVSIAAGEDGIAGSVGINFNSEFKSIGNEKKLKLQSIGISSLYVQSTVYGLTIEGEVEFYNDLGADLVGSKGARGDLQLMLPAGFGARMAAEFGTKVSDADAPFGTAQNFNYWYLDGMVYFGPAGIPIGSSGLGIYGFGGGVLVNMTRGSSEMDQDEVNSMLADVNALEVSGSETTNVTTRTNTLPTPNFSNYGLKIAATIGTFPIPQMINMDVSLSAEFGDGLGLNLIEIGGDVFMLCDLSQRAQSGLWCTSNLRWEKISSSHNVYSGGMDLFLKIGPLKGDPEKGNKVISADFFAESGGDGKWYFHAGNPDDRGYLQFKFPFLPSIEGSAYFMTGHDLPIDLPVPDKVAWLMNNSSTGDDKNSLDNTNPVKSGGEQRNEGDAFLNQLGSGLAFGAELSVSPEINAFLIYLRATAYLGFDINITKSSQRTCYIEGEGNIAPGWNDWYARGQVYAGVEGELGIAFRFKGKGFDITLFELGAAMMLSGGGPNPEWAEGRAGVYYSVLGGAVDGYAKFDVTIGDICVPQNSNPLGDLEIIYAHEPVDGEEDVSVFVDPSATFVLPIDEEIVLPSYDDEGNTVDVTIKFELDRFKIEHHTTKADVGIKSTLWNEYNTLATIDLDEVLADFTQYDGEVKLIAWEKDGWDWNRMKNDDGSNWEEIKTWDFETGELPYPIPDEAVLTTIPLRKQRYYLQDEGLAKIGKIEFAMDVQNEDSPSGGYFPGDDDKWDYSYYVRWQDLAGGEPDIFELNTVEGASVIEQILMTHPTLKNNTIHSCQLIRKKVRKTSFGNIDLPFAVVTKSIVIAPQQLEMTSNVNINQTPLNPGEALSTNEELIYQFYFKTSKFDTYEEKMATLSMDYEVFVDGLDMPEYEYPLISIYGDEGFDTYDIHGETAEDGSVLHKPRFTFFTDSEANQVSYAGGANQAAGSNGFGSGSKAGSDGGFLTSTNGQSDYFDFVFEEVGLFEDLTQPFRSIAHDVSYTGTYTNTNPSFVQKTYTSTINYLNMLPPIMEWTYDFVFDYANPPLRMDFNPDISGYKGLLTDAEIENAWENHLSKPVIVLESIDAHTQKFTADNTIAQQITGGTFNGSAGSGSGPSSGGFNNFEANTDVVVANMNNQFSNNMNAYNQATALGTDESNGPVRLTVPYKLFPVVESDIYKMWDYAYTRYTEQHMVVFRYMLEFVSPHIPDLEITEAESVYKWKSFIISNYYDFIVAMNRFANRSEFYMQEHPGEYKLKMEGNQAYGDVFVNGGSKTLKFTLD